MSLNCVTGMKAKETGRLVKVVTLVTPVTPVLEEGRICARMLPFQIVSFAKNSNRPEAGLQNMADC